MNETEDVLPPIRCEYEDCHKKADPLHIVRQRKWSFVKLFEFSYCDDHLHLFLKTLPALFEDSRAEENFQTVRAMEFLQWRYPDHGLFLVYPHQYGPERSVLGSGTFTHSSGTFSIGSWGTWAMPSASGGMSPLALDPPDSIAFNGISGEMFTVPLPNRVDESPPSVPGPP